jgi:hypothetical protein
VLSSLDEEVASFKKVCLLDTSDFGEKKQPNMVFHELKRSGHRYSFSGVAVQHVGLITKRGVMALEVVNHCY